MQQLLFRAIAEPEPGPKWLAQHDRTRDSYERWFFHEGDVARPSFQQCARALHRHMPELTPTWEALVDLAGGGDVTARLLSLYRPSPFLTACSQVAWTGEEPALIRNYDYAPRLCEGVILRSQWDGVPVLAVSDCLWGVLDGMNAAGLAVSLAFGGRRAVGDGFGIPLILRYILQTCATVGDATRALARIPVHMAYNITLIDSTRAHATAHIGPDRPATITRDRVATNHQGRVEWERWAKVTSSPEREAFLRARLADPTETPDALAGRFLRPPLYSACFAPHSAAAAAGEGGVEAGRASGGAGGWGTLYTAHYRPRLGEAAFLWPAQVMRQSIDGFAEQEVMAVYGGAGDPGAGVVPAAGGPPTA